MNAEPPTGPWPDPSLNPIQRVEVVAVTWVNDGHTLDSVDVIVKLPLETATSANVRVKSSRRKAGEDTAVGFHYVLEIYIYQ